MQDQNEIANNVRWLEYAINNGYEEHAVYYASVLSQNMALLDIKVTEIPSISIMASPYDTGGATVLLNLPPPLNPNNSNYNYYQNAPNNPNLTYSQINSNYAYSKINPNYNNPQRFN